MVCDHKPAFIRCSSSTPEDAIKVRDAKSTINRKQCNAAM